MSPQTPEQSTNPGLFSILQMLGLVPKDTTADQTGSTGQTGSTSPQYLDNPPPVPITSYKTIHAADPGGKPVAYNRLPDWPPAGYWYVEGAATGKINPYGKAFIAVPDPKHPNDSAYFYKYPAPDNPSPGVYPNWVKSNAEELFRNSEAKKAAPHNPGDWWQVTEQATKGNNSRPGIGSGYGTPYNPEQGYSSPNVGFSAYDAHNMNWTPHWWTDPQTGVEPQGYSAPGLGENLWLPINRRIPLPNEPDPVNPCGDLEPGEGCNPGGKGPNGASSTTGGVPNFLQSLFQQAPPVAGVGGMPPDMRL